MAQIRKEDLVNPVLIQRIKKLEDALEQSEREKRRLKERIRLQDARLGEYRRMDMVRYERHRERRVRRREIATEWLVGGGVAGLLLTVSLAAQRICLYRWGLMP